LLKPDELKVKENNKKQILIELVNKFFPEEAQANSPLPNTAASSSAAAANTSTARLLMSLPSAQVIDQSLKNDYQK